MVSLTLKLSEIDLKNMKKSFILSTLILVSNLNIAFASITKIPDPKKFPEEVNAFIEIPHNQIGVKYELHQESGVLLVDRFLTAPMVYPANYGFITNTLAPDGDPLDILVVTPFPIMSGTVIKAKVIGVLETEDNKGRDPKIIAVPSPSVSKEYEHINEIEDLPPLLLKQIQHFFATYKQLEGNKYSKSFDYHNSKKAINVINEDRARYNKSRPSK